MDTSSSSSQQILTQIFGQHSPHVTTDEQQQQQNNSSSSNGRSSSNGGTPFPIGGGRNQYMEVERFDTEEQFQIWLQAQGRKWGIVQKGRVTIEDIIDQYACVFRRRKGYACRVQMRVRHNRRSGHKVVEVLPIAHDHTFYGPALPAEFDDGMLSMVPDSAAVKAFASSLGSSLSAGDLENSGIDDRQFGCAVGNEVFADLKQEFSDFSSMLPGEGGMETQMQNQQPMDLLWSNILNNPAIQQFANGELTAEMQNDAGIGKFGAEEGADEAEEERQEQMRNGEAREEEEGNGEPIESEQLPQQQQQQQMDDDEGQMLLECQTELLANCVADKVAAYLAIQFEPKFTSILMALDSLAKGMDGLKRQMAASHHQQPQTQLKSREQLPESRQSISTSKFIENGNGGISGGNRSSSTQQFPGILQPFIQKKKAMEKQWHPKEEQKQSAQELSKISTPTAKQGHRFVPIKFASSPSFSSNNKAQQIAFSSSASTKSASTKCQQSMSVPLAPPAINSNGIDKSRKAQQQQQGHEPMVTTACKSPFSMRLNSVIKTAGRHFGLGGLSLHTPMKTSRKSVHAYRQRRRELSYRFMKEVGMSLTINGITKSIFHWRAAAVNAACQAKREELIMTGKPVIYRGNDVTEMLYRVDCSRDLVNGRRCGQMIADSLWPRGYFQTRMLMPILKGVSHRSKKRVDGSARKPVATDQFEIFKVALLLLGGFLMDESDRSKWMETAREGVNQRGLDELANSKRAHYEYEGGPLFVQDGNVDEEEEELLEAEEHAEIEPQNRSAGDDDDDIADDLEHQSATAIAAYLARLPINLDFLRSDEQQENEVLQTNDYGMESMLYDKGESMNEREGNVPNGQFDEQINNGGV